MNKLNGLFWRKYVRINVEPSSNLGLSYIIRNSSHPEHSDIAVGRKWVQSYTLFMWNSAHECTCVVVKENVTSWLRFSATTGMNMQILIYIEKPVSVLNHPAYCKAAYTLTELNPLELNHIWLAKVLQRQTHLFWIGFLHTLSWIVILMTYYWVAVNVKGGYIINNLLGAL
jgi:hypothetical protein